MKMRTTRYCIKEGLVNIFRNKLMSLASMTVITASLVLFGVFIIVTTNLEYNSLELSKQPQMQVFADFALDERDVEGLYSTIENHQDVEMFEFIDKQGALAKAKAIVGDEGDLLEGLGDDFLPISFIVTLRDPSRSELVAKEFRNLQGVASVSYSQETINFITTVVTWVRYFSGFLMILLSVVSVLIISNTIRIAMSARKVEINIMKYIGSTDWFIRWPYIVEGLVIGVIGSAIGYFIVVYLYDFLLNNYAYRLEILKFVDVQHIAREIIPVYLVIGVFVGIVGSVVSIRKYLKV
jgi:cell division transport system permease protein